MTASVGRLGLASALAVAAALAAMPSGAGAAPLCDSYASPAGSDSAPGTAAAPYRSVKKAIESLTPGSTACLRGGTYPGPDNGAAVPSPLYMDDADSTLRGFPGETATVDARVELTGARTTVTELTIDTATLNTTVTPLKLVGDGSRLSHSRVTGHLRLGTCVQVGSGSAKPSGIVVEHNEIYGCGADEGGQNKFDHNVYVTRARDAVVRWNVLHDNAGGWGVHLYPDADGTLVEHNMIDSDHGGVVFAGDGSGATSDDNEVRLNSITYPDTGGGQPRYNLEGSWSGGPKGTGNVAEANCLHSAGAGGPSGIQDPPSGFSASNNVVMTAGADGDGVVDPFRLWANNPCSAAPRITAGPHP